MREAPVLVDRYFQTAAFDGEATATMGAAFEDAMTSASIVDRNDPLAELIAHKIMQLYRLGERDTVRLSDRALTELGVPLSARK